jgi:hypothetical protein
MAPHDTNTPKEARRHAGPLIGMAAVVLFAVGLILWWAADSLSGNGDVPNAPTPSAATGTAPADGTE